MADPPYEGLTVYQLSEKEQWVLANALEYASQFGEYIQTTGPNGKPGLADFCKDTDVHPNIPKDWIDKPDKTTLVRNAARRLRGERYLIAILNDVNDARGTRVMGGVHIIGRLPTEEERQHLTQILHKYD